MPTVNELQLDLESRLLGGVAGPDLERGRGLLFTLACDWLDEARAAGALASQVLTSLCSDFERDAGPLSPRDRLVLLEAEYFDHKLRAMGNWTFELGQQIVDGQIDDDLARANGQAMLGWLEGVAPRIDAITLESRRVALRRQLDDVMLEARYAVERKAMSPRLSRYAQDVGAPPVR
jgi:hypothetical protein